MGETFKTGVNCCFGLVGAGLVSLFGFDGSLVENGVEVWFKME